MRSAIASEVAVSGEPACTMLRRSLSSDAAASLATALTCAASATGSFPLSSNQSDASARPALARARLRMTRVESRSVPQVRSDGTGDQHGRVIERLRRRPDRR
jgi:hypothetical protein